jgi:hypothetical protein
MMGNTASMSNPDANPGKEGTAWVVSAQTVGPKLETAHANPIRIPLIVAVISGTILCPITMFAACPP